MKKILCTIALLASAATMACAQSTLDIAADNTNAIGGTIDYVYDRVDMVRNVPASTATLFAVPATVDGYYFGADAKRWEVTVKADGQHVLLPMDDLADFEPNHLYIVKPEANCGATVITSIVAGTKVTVPASTNPLVCDDVYTTDTYGNTTAAIGSVSNLVNELKLGNYNLDQLEDLVKLVLHEL